MMLHFEPLKNLNFFFSPRHCVACRILVPQLELEPGSSAVEAWNPNHWSASVFPIGFQCRKRLLTVQTSSSRRLVQQIMVHSYSEIIDSCYFKEQKFFKSQNGMTAKYIESEKESESEVTQSCPTLRPCGLQPTRFLCPWDSPGKNTGVGCHFLLQGVFLTQGLNPGLPHCRQML